MPQVIEGFAVLAGNDGFANEGVVEFAPEEDDAETVREHLENIFDDVRIVKATLVLKEE